MKHPWQDDVGSKDLLPCNLGDPILSLGYLAHGMVLWLFHFLTLLCAAETQTSQRHAFFTNRQSAISKKPVSQVIQFHKTVFRQSEGFVGISRQGQTIILFASPATLR
jgi:hypothetical protein